MDIDENPKTFKEAMCSRDVSFWKEAINDEIDSITENQTWKLVDLLLGCESIGCKWIFKRKRRVDGSIEKFKARLVAKDFKRKEGVDYFDTNSPIARMITIRILVTLTIICDLLVHQTDVKIAFLNSDLNEEIYMERPEDFVLKNQEHKVYKLAKSLYDLNISWYCNEY